MTRTPSQEVMDAARGDPEGKRRAAAYERYSAVQEETNANGWTPDLRNLEEMWRLDIPVPMATWRDIVMPTFRIDDIRPFPCGLRTRNVVVENNGE